MDKKAKTLVIIVWATAAVTSFGVASNVYADNVATDTQSGIHQDINHTTTTKTSSKAVDKAQQTAVTSQKAVAMLKVIWTMQSKMKIKLKKKQKL